MNFFHKICTGKINGFVSRFIGSYILVLDYDLKLLFFNIKVYIS